MPLRLGKSCCPLCSCLVFGLRPRLVVPVFQSACWSTLQPGPFGKNVSLPVEAYKGEWAALPPTVCLLGCVLSRAWHLGRYFSRKLEFWLHTSCDRQQGNPTLVTGTGAKQPVMMVQQHPRQGNSSRSAGHLRRTRGRPPTVESPALSELST